MSIISAGTLVTNALTHTADRTGRLVFQTNGSTTALTLDSSADATFAGSVSVTGNLTVAGTTTSFGDNDKIVLGDGQDLQIYHDGSNSYIKDNGTGSLILDGNVNASSSLSIGSGTQPGVLYVYGGATGEGGEIRIYPSEAEDTIVDNWSIDVATDDLRIFNSLGDLSAEFITNGGVKLYYDNSLKLQTTSTGVSVTGQLSGNVGLTPQVITTNTTGSAGNYYFLNSAGLTLTLPASPSVGDMVGFSDVANDATHTIGRNGSNIMGDAADMTVDTAYQNFTLMYTGATVGWAFAR